MRPDRVLKRIGRYSLYHEFAKGGTATVHFGRLIGAAGFGRTVAIKRLHPDLAEDPEFVRMLIDEARVAARVNHPNVVQTFDVVVSSGDTYLVMEYVRGVPLSLLMKRSRMRGRRIDTGIVTAIMANVLHGLHAAHEAADEQGRPLNMVHRDVSPQNLLCGVDGVTRVLDFGIAKATGFTAMTREGYVKGKLAYMAPEQILGRELDRRTDIFAAAVVLWELLTGERLFGGGRHGDTVSRIMNGQHEAPSRWAPWIGEMFDEYVLRCLDRDVDARFPTAREAAMALEECSPMAPPSEIGAWVEELAGDVLAAHRKALDEIESGLASDLLAEATPTGMATPTAHDVTPVGAAEPSHEAPPPSDAPIAKDATRSLVSQEEAPARPESDSAGSLDGQEPLAQPESDIANSSDGQDASAGPEGRTTPEELQPPPPAQEDEPAADIASPPQTNDQASGGFAREEPSLLPPPSPDRQARWTNLVLAIGLTGGGVALALAVWPMWQRQHESPEAHNRAASAPAPAEMQPTGRLVYTYGLQPSTDSPAVRTAEGASTAAQASSSQELVGAPPPAASSDVRARAEWAPSVGPTVSPEGAASTDAAVAAQKVAPAVSSRFASSWSARAPAAAARAATVSSPSTRSAECSPPYVVDSQGIKTYKLGCL